MMPWRLLELTPGFGALAVIAIVLTLGRRGISWLPVIGVAIAALEITWRATHRPPGMELWVQGYWLGLLIPTSGIGFGIWAAMIASRDANASRWVILAWTTLGAFAASAAALFVALYVSCWAGWGCL